MPPQPKLRILIVDDNPTDRLIARSVVSRLKPSLIHEAENGAVAELKLKTAAEIRKPYHVVLLDWNMPNANGQKVLELIRSNAALKKTGVIIMTGTADRDVVKAAIQLSVDDFIVKPIDHALLIQKLQKVLA